ncbi:MAG: 2,3-dihydroxyphenylpropionate 1,2-dioxygenase, partial [Gammaproteobacteria bacterium]
GVDGCCQQGARSENTPVFDRRATPLAVPSSSRIGRVISRQILISDEHFNVFDPDCYPSFGVVTAAHGCRPVESCFGLPRGSIDVTMSPALAESILATGLHSGFDLARIGSGNIEHGFLTCGHFLTPQWDREYVWLIQNCVLPPLPSVSRCCDFSPMVRDAIRAWDSPKRVPVGCRTR